MQNTANNNNAAENKGDIMPDLFNKTKEMNTYFHSLPKSVQSSLVYSGAKANSLADLKQLVNNFKGNEPTQQ